MVELGGKDEHRRHAFRFEPDEQHHLAVPELVILGYDIKLVGLKRRQALQIARADLKGLEVLTSEVIELGVQIAGAGAGPSPL
jgi:hypothetical protein